jgi:hypothetical protein
MAIDLSLLAIPKEGQVILKKAKNKIDSEYSDIIFLLPEAFKKDFKDFNHPDWIEFKSDAQNLAKKYPNKIFLKKFHLETNRLYEVFDYLFAKIKDSKKDFREMTPFFYDGVEFDSCISGQGQILKYWDTKTLKKKKELIESINFDNFYKNYDFETMTKEGVYKIKQINSHKKSIELLFNELKDFIKNAIKLDGLVLILKS